MKQGKGEVFCRRLIALGAKMALFPVALQRIPYPNTCTCERGARVPFLTAGIPAYRLPKVCSQIALSGNTSRSEV